MTSTTQDNKGLSSLQVPELQHRYGFNELPEHHDSLALLFFKNFWGPLAWLMELTILITYLSGRTTEALVIVALLLINSGVSIYQRRSADRALEILSSHLQVKARVRRDGRWKELPARELVPGDVIRLRTGDIAPADTRLIEGTLSVDVSALTGESLPQEAGPGATCFSGSTIKHGEATAHVTATGTNTAYGKTTKLLEVAHPPTHMERIIYGIIRYFFILNLGLAAVIGLFGTAVQAPTTEVVNFVIVLLLTSVPVAFPTMFAVAQSYGALLLGKRGEGVLVRRLAAVQEGASMDVLCSDKTGTLTQNRLTVASVTTYGKATEKQVLALAAACSDEADADSIDQAILNKVSAAKIRVPKQLSFTPFDPALKHTEATVRDGQTTLKVLKGFPSRLLESANHAKAAAEDLSILSQKGLRVVAVVTMSGGRKTCVGLLGLADPIRPDAPKLIGELSDLGIRTIMITGDGAATAATVAEQLGIQGDVITATQLRANPKIATEGAVFAEAYPEDKLIIIRALQAAGHTVGMTGDGVNDAPALRQAEVGVAVAGATDVAKSSASYILTQPGLEGVVQAVKVSRGVYVRLRTWALNKIVKSIEVSIFSTIIFFVTHSFILSPLLAVLLLFANDFVTISIATDNTEAVAQPAHWQVKKLMSAAGVMAVAPLALMFITYLAAVRSDFSLDVIRTITYLALLLYGKATLYALRAWPHAWSVKPSSTLVWATLFSCLFAIAVSSTGWLVPSVSWWFIGFILVTAVINFFLIDFIKSRSLVRRLISA